MDFLKTLLMYMTMMTALSVQEGPLPQSVPTPTALPAYVTATPVPFSTEAPTATPAPTAAPVPTITPNRRYETLNYGSNGSDVRKLQRKLIELGYMPAGSDDGSYGYQTYNAVKAFQQANGLEADGLAGPATLTNLYENPDIIAKVTATAVPTATPPQTLPPLEFIEGVTVAPGNVEAAYTPEPVAAPAPVAGLTELTGALVIDGSVGEALTKRIWLNDAAAEVSPTLWMNEDGQAVLALKDLADCFEGWTLAGSSADGSYTLKASGYTVALQVGENGATVLVDGEAITVDPADVQLLNGTLYVTDAFLQKTIKAVTVFDADERSLVIFLIDKNIVNAMD